MALKVRLPARDEITQEPLEAPTARAEAIRLAKHVHHAEVELKTNYADIATLVVVAVSSTAGLTQDIGIGPVTVATALVALSHTGRLCNEATFAALAGTKPLLESSVKTTQYRLNRCGDRQLNRALNVTALVRMVYDPKNTTLRQKTARRRQDGLGDPPDSQPVSGTTNISPLQQRFDS